MPTTRAAFANWNSRIAPLFDTTRVVCVVHVESGRILETERKALTGDLPVQRATRLVELGVSTLVCGAISNPMSETIVAHGINVIPFVSGDLREVIQAWLEGSLGNRIYSMPGCYGRGRHCFQSISNIEPKGQHIRNRHRGGNGMQGGQGRGRRGRPVATGVGGTCVCPKCGYREPDERGVLCVRKPCPKCGTVLTKEQ